MATVSHSKTEWTVALSLPSALFFFLLFLLFHSFVTVNTQDMLNRLLGNQINAHYKEEHLNSDEWCCVIYTFKNAGKTDISSMDIIWHFQQSSCIFPADETRQWAEGNLLNYAYCYDKKIRVGDTVSMKVCYHKDAIIPGLISATISIGMIDDNGRYWTQPLFAPQDKLYDSRAISPKDYIEQTRTDMAEECFKKPWLW